MANAINDGMNKPDQSASLNGQAMDFGSSKGSGNSLAIVFTQTFTAAPNVIVMPTVGSTAVGGYASISDVGTGSFVLTTGSNVEAYWIATGSGSY